MRPILALLISAVAGLAADGRVITENGTNILAIGIDSADYEFIRFYLKGTNVIELHSGSVKLAAQSSPMPSSWGATNVAGHAGLTNAERLPIFRWRDVFTNKFTTLQAGANVTLTDEGTNIVITATGGGGGDAGGTNSRQHGTLTLTNISANPIPFTNIMVAGANVTLTTNNGVVTVAATGGGGGATTTLTARATANIVNTNTAFVDATNLTFSVAANANYRFRFVVHYTTAATTTGARFAINGPASPTALRVGGTLPTGTAAMNNGSQTAYNTAIFAATTGPGATAVTGVIEGVFRNGTTAGTLALRVASEIGLSAVTILAESHGELTPF